MKYVLAVDIGSTFTKVTAIGLAEKRVLGCAKAFTTIETNICEGLYRALDELYAVCGAISFDQKLASSSAAGGLKMISCGLVPELSVKAAKMAASSAGAKVIRAFSYELNHAEQAQIYDANPDIILLSGGIDGGNKDVILRNSHALAEINRNFAVIVAGNKCVSDEVTEILRHSGKRVIACENVMPELNRLNILPAKSCIRELFIENIIEAKGLAEVQKMMDRQIVPTPLAVLEAAELLSTGTTNTQGIGELLAFDVGGATTDVYSMASGEPTKSNVVLKGLKEPFAKRSVEGDIGVRYSLPFLIEEATVEAIVRGAGVLEKDVSDWLAICQQTPDVLPEPGSVYQKLDDEMAAQAVGISANRHCGSFESAYTPFGETILQNGKDLSPVHFIIGTGGAVIHSRSPHSILQNALYSVETMNVLKPVAAEMLLDRKNIFAAMGLLAKIEPDTALELMKNEFIQI